MKFRNDQTAEDKAKTIEMVESTLKTMSDDIIAMQAELNAPVLRGENTLLILKDNSSALTIKGDSYRLGTVRKGVFFTAKLAAEIASIWNTEHSDLEIVPLNWTQAYRRVIESHTALIGEMQARLEEFRK